MSAHSGPHEVPGDLHGYCPMEKDKLDNACTCPDLTVKVTIRLAKPFMPRQSSWLCFCCGNPIDMNHAYFGRSTA